MPVIPVLLAAVFLAHFGWLLRRVHGSRSSRPCDRRVAGPQRRPQAPVCRCLTNDGDPSAMAATCAEPHADP